MGDGKDECLVPSDSKSSGFITDDELKEKLVDPLPKGVFLFILLDCCHSGNLDLPCVAKVNGNQVSMKKDGDASEATVVLCAACQDDQQARDGRVNGRFTGAMTAAFDEVLRDNRNLTSEQLLIRTRDWMKSKMYGQVPQLCSGTMIDVDKPFLETMGK